MIRIGVDVGGTHIGIGVVDNSVILARRTVPFPQCEDTGAAAATIIADGVHEVMARLGIPEQEITGIGLAVPGSIDQSGERVINAHNLNFHDEPFKGRVQSFFPDVPVFLMNDADAAAQAELCCGAFVGCKTAVLMMLGTGVGGAVVLKGQVFKGGNHSGVELGHMVLSRGGNRCTCGNRGCVETEVSAGALVREANLAMREHPESMLKSATGGFESAMTAKLVAECARGGDPAAQQVWMEYVDALADAVVSVIHILDPEVIAIGGGVAQAGAFLFVPLRKLVDGKCFFDDFGSIVPAELGTDAGIIGAAMMGQTE